MQTPLPKRLIDGDLWNVLDVVTIACVSLGYLVALTFRPELQWSGFLMLTIVQIVWFISYRYLVACSPRNQWLAMLGIAGTAIAVTPITSLGVGYDWLLPVISMGMLVAVLPLRRALLPSLAIWIGTIFTLAYPFTTTITTWQYWQNLFSLSIAFIFAAVFSFMMRQHSLARAQMHILVDQVERSHDALQSAHAQLRAYAEQVEELTVTRERNRMAREIHDTLGHYLTILALKLETATKLEERADPRLHDELIEARRVATECLAEVRHSVAALRPADLATQSFPDALERLVSEFCATCPTLEVVTDLGGDLATVSPECRLALYRASQEALTNIRKHAQATKVLLRLRVNADVAELTVIDNGVGGTTETAPTLGFGLTGMRERLALLEGTANAGPMPGKGWRVEVVLPLRRRAPADTDAIFANAGLLAESAGVR